MKDADHINSFDMSVLEEEQCNYYKGLKHLVLAKAYECQENNHCAAENYKLSLRYNCENYEAFERLIGNYLLTQDEKDSFISEMVFNEDSLWLKDYYVSRVQGSIRENLEGTVVVNIDDPSIQSPNVKHYSPETYYDIPGHSMQQFYGHATPPQSKNIGKTPEVKRNIVESSEGKREKEVNVIEILRNGNNHYIKIIEAEKYYNSQNVTKAYEIIKHIVDEDMYFLNAIPLYTAILIELNQVGDLYILAHNLVSSNPDLAVSWFTVGSYYYLVRKYDLARKYFEKANKFDKHFAACWIAFGHSFAASDESDQAMSAYRTAARLFPGCHLANQCIGMEYLRTNKLSTALIAFEQAQKINSKD
jgi:anaphase-promoting complex subunit 6